MDKVQQFNNPNWKFGVRFLAMVGFFSSPSPQY